MRRDYAFDIKSLSRLSVDGFILYSPVSILAYPVSVLVVNPKSSAIHLIFFGFLITFVTIISYLLLITILNKFKASRSVYRITFFLLIIAFTGAFRGIVFFYANEYQELTQPSSLNNRIFASMFTTLFWLSASNIIINISRNFKRTYQSALNQFLRSHVGVIKNDLNIAIANPELDVFEKDLSHSLSELLGNTDPDTIYKVSQNLTSLINEQLRPISRRIWLRSLTEYPVINYKSLLGDSLRLLNFSQVAFFGIMSVLALLDNLFLRGINESILRSMSYLLVTFLLLFFLSKFRKRFSGYFLNIPFLFLISLIPIFASEIFAGVLGFENNYLAAFLITPAPAAVIVVLSLLNLTQKDRDFLLSLLDKSSDTIYKKVSAGIDLDQRQIASYLHNSFQSELLALSAQLAAVALSGDKEDTSSALQRASAVAARSLSEDLARINEQPLDRLLSVIASWKNILEIKVEIPAYFLHERCNSIVFIQTVEEIASNAFRHDKATILNITAQIGDLGTRVFFQSNGSQPISKSEGMGHSWLNQVSLTPYSISKNEIGTLIALEI